LRVVDFFAADHASLHAPFPTAHLKRNNVEAHPEEIVDNVRAMIGVETLEQLRRIPVPAGVTPSLRAERRTLLAAF
jgi:hypothetical protein